MFQVRFTDVRREVDEMLEGFEHQATFSLKKIDRRFESLGQSLDEEFRQYFLQVSIEILSTSYTKVQIESNRIQMKTSGLINKPSTHTEYGLSDDDQSTSAFLGSLVTKERIHSISDDDNVNVKSEEDANQLNSVIEILSSSDEEDSDESQNYHLETKIECEETDWMNDAIGNEMSHNNDEGTSDEVSSEEDFDIEPKLEMIDKDPNDVSLNGGYNTGNDVTNENRARSTSRQKEDKEKPSCSKNAKLFNCELCEYGSDRKYDFNVHMRTHTKEKPYQCSRCSKRFTRPLTLRKHMVRHKSEFQFHCSNCFRGFFQSGEKVAHEKKCRNRRYECYICKYFATNKTNLIIHMWTHTKDAKRFQCKHCDYGTYQKGDLMVHMRTHTKEKPYLCSRCSKRFTQSSTLRKHMVTHKSEFPFHCSNCFRGFFQINEKVAHEKSCRNRCYECYVCKYFIANKTNLVIHMRTHSGNKPYRCNRCYKGFTKLHDLKKHMTTHKDKNLPFHCKGCFRRFPDESEKKAHEKDCRYRRYECKVCKKFVTARKASMEIHMRIHTGEKPFRCEVCMKCFNQKAILTRHLKTQHKTVS